MLICDHLPNCGFFCFQAHKAVKSIYQSLEHISDAPARQEVFRYLRILGSSQPLEVVKTLLSCCVQCDR